MEEEEIVVSYLREGDDIHHLMLGSEALADIRIDYTGIPKEQRGGTATKLLSAAALYCFASTLGSALGARGAQIRSLTGRAVAQKGRDSYYRTKVNSIRIEVDVQLGDDDLSTLEKCKSIMERGCLITYSLEEGIEMNYSISCPGPSSASSATPASH